MTCRLCCCVWVFITTYETRYFNNRRQESTAFQVSVYNLKAFSEKVAPYLVLKQMSERKCFSESNTDNVSREIFFERAETPPGMVRSAA